ncbi:MAG: aminotransferase class I/II-fold pyridoxal phosphate-dependent enzyme [Nitrososphaerota archaeon]
MKTESEADMELDSLRQEVYDITREIIRLAAKRRDVAIKIGKIKTDASLPLNDIRVEDELLKMVIDESNKNSLDPQSGIWILSLLLRQAKESQRREQNVETPTAIMTIAKNLEEKGKKLVRLDVGETNFEPPTSAVNAAIESMHSQKTHYTVARGIPELIESIKRYIQRRYSFNARDDQIVATPGGRFAIYSALAYLLRKGGSCVIIDPSWPAYKQMVEHLGGRIIIVSTELEEEWEPSIEKVKEAIKPDTRALFLNYPCNPTGKVISKKKFEEIVKVASERKVTVISDEIYSTYSNVEVPSVLEYELTNWLYIGSFSKAWAMTGFRLGFAVGNPELIKEMVNFMSLAMTSLPEFLQYSAIAALSSEKEVERNAIEMKSRIERACEELDRIKSIKYYKPDGGIYVFPRVPEQITDFSRRLLEEKGVTVVPGISFGNYPNFFRISLGNSEETIVDGIRKMGELLR